jgi:hypothetical protein
MPNMYVDLRDPLEIPERLRRPVRKLQLLLANDGAFSEVVSDAVAKGVASVDDFTPEQTARMVSQMGGAADLLDELNDRMVLERVMGWSFDQPVTMDGLQELPGPVYDELRELCSTNADAGPDFSPTPDPASPTVPSSA